MHPTDTTLPQVIDDCHELLKWLIPLTGPVSPHPALHPGGAPGVRPVGRAGGMR